MCGICGVYMHDRSPDDITSLLRRMNANLVHRGPDEEGYFTDARVGLGVRRLRVIDLVTGSQPIASEDGTVRVVLNGEIFNYRELRRLLEEKGHRFATHTDTEVIVHLYEEKGTGLLDDLNGEFAFALWDAGKKILFVARDRFGVKPLFYCRASSGEFFFASELKALMCAMPFAPMVNQDVLQDYLRLQYIPSPDTILQNVSKLPPSHYFTFDGSAFTVRRYWRMPLPESAAGKTFKESDACESLLSLLDDSVRMRLVSDVPLGAFLSGGIDSSSIVALACRHAGGSLRTFSIGFHESEFNELPFARRVAGIFGTKHTDVTVDISDADALIADIVWHLDEPFADSSAVPTWILSKMTAQHMVVALSGDGGDELFAGYPKYSREVIFARLRSLPGFRRVSPFIHRISEAAAPEGKKGVFSRVLRTLERASQPLEQRYAFWGFFFSESQIRSLMTSSSRTGSRSAVVRMLNTLDGAPDDLSKILCADAQLYLPDDLLVKVDRMSMAHSLEVRVPFLDHRIAERAARIPSAYKIRHLQTKYLLKKMMRGVLPGDIVFRPKKGFTVPLDSWFRGALGTTAEKILTSPHAQRRGYFDNAYVSRLIAAHRQGNQNHGHRLWALLVLELWHRIFMDNKGNYRKGMKLGEFA